MLDKEATIMNQTFMKEKRILPLVLSMSLPMVISMAVNSLYNIIDSYFVAKVSEDAMTALALVYPVQNLINAIAIGFGIGMNAIIAFYLGAGDQTRADKAATQGLLLSFLHGVLLAMICIAGMPLFLKHFSSDAQITELALLYAGRAFLFSPVINLGLAYEKIFQSVGKMKVSMFSMMCGCVVNIILDPLMIFGIGIFPALGIAGAAYATGIGQCVTLVMYLLIYAVCKTPVQIRRTYLRPDRAIIQRLYTIGISAALNLALPSLLISVLNGLLAEFSEKYVLVLGVYYKLQTFIYLTANGIIQGIRPLMGYNFGAGEQERVKKIYRVDCSRMADWFVYGQQRNDPNRGYGTARHQSRLCRVRCLHYLFRCTGGIGKRIPVTVYLTAAVCNCYYPCRVSV